MRACVIAILLSSLVTTGAFSQTYSEAKSAVPPNTPTPTKLTPASPSEAGSLLPVFVTDLIVQDKAPGSGPVATTGQMVDAHYTGWLYDPKAPQGRGKKFDSSLDRSKPISFTLGAGRVIMGWELGVAGMQVGGKRTLIIPPRLAYGERNVGNGLIPPNSTLMFDIELVKIQGESQTGVSTTAK